MKTGLKKAESSYAIWWQPGLLVAVGLAMYWQSLNNGYFTLDDITYARDNALLQNGSWTAFFTQAFEGMYQPLLLVSLSLDHWIGAGDPWFYHFTNVVLHVSNAVLVFLLMKKLSNKPLLALMAAFLFMLHPSMVESTAWITARKDLLFSFFYLLGMLSWLSYQQKKNKSLYLLTLILFLFSVLSKVQAVSFPLALLVLDYLTTDQKITKKSLLHKAPFFIVSLIFGLLVFFFAIGEKPDLSFWERIVYSSYAIGFYLIHSLLPISNLILNPFPEIIKPIHYTGFLALAALVFILLKFKNNKWIVAGISFFLIQIVLLLPILPNSFIFYANKYMYLSIIGILLIYIDLYDKIILQNKWALFFLPLLLFFGQSTRGELEQWNDPVELWDEVVDAYPQAVEGWENRGYMNYLSGKNELALNDFLRSVEINPARYNSRSNAGAILTDLHQYPEAAVHLDKALELKPGDEVSLFNRSIAYQYSGRLEDAKRDIEEVIRLKPENANYLLTRGAILINAGAFAQALEDLNKSIRINPKNHLAFSNRGLCYVRLGDIQNAYKDFTSTLTLKPDFPDAWSNRGLLLLNQGKPDAAIQDLSRAIQLAPGFGVAYLNRGRAWKALNQQEKACQDFQQALSLGIQQAQIEMEQYCQYAKQ